MDLAAIYEKLASYCAYQERCLYDVREKMRELGVAGSTAQQALVERLQEEEFLDETRYAKLFARSKFNQNHWGRRKIAFAMQQKRVPAPLIALGLAELDDEDYAEQLYSLLEKKRDGLKGKLPAKECMHKLTQYALSKGYEADDIRIQLKRLFSET